MIHGAGKSFIGILLAIGLAELPEFYDYWAYSAV